MSESQSLASCLALRSQFWCNRLLLGDTRCPGIPNIVAKDMELSFLLKLG